jgi:hypothetical protein
MLAANNLKGSRRESSRRREEKGAKSMSAQSHEILFEEEQGFRQRWVWALMGATLVMLVVPLGLVLFGAPVKAGSDVLPGVLGLALASPW